MIRVCLLVALVACSKTPRSSHEEVPAAPVTRPIDAQAIDAQAIDAQAIDAQVIDAPVLVDAPRADAAIDAGKKPPKPDAGVKASEKLGKAGDVCAHGSRNRDPEERLSTPVLKCGPGLMCCYPCGIPGCDSVCKTSCPAVP